MNEQLTLFELTAHQFEDGLECNNCGIVQPVENFQHMASGEIKRKCRTCARDQSNLIKYLKKIHPYPADGYCCPICKRDIEQIARKGQKRLQNWVLDHCHDTETFRGWVCHHCNVGLGAFSDDLQRVENAAAYLQRHKENT
jgi:hypothetical protein